MACENSGKHETGDAESIVFEAVLRPHCSLSPRGFVVIMSLVALASAAIGTGFSLLGAWPVIGFLGLDAILIYAALRMGFRAARRSETVRLFPNELEIVALNEAGHGRRTVMQPYWAQVDLQAGAGGRTQLFVRSHARQLELGSFLAPDRKAAFADALSEALRKLRNPVVRC